MKKLSFFVLTSVFLLLVVSVGYAQTPPAPQTAGGVVQQEKQRIQQQKLKDRIETDRPVAKEVAEEDVVIPDKGPQVKIDKIVVEGATLLTSRQIMAITGEYEGKKLSIKDMQKVADLITDEYRKKGYVTSRAYIPPQSIQNNTLVIRIIEGKLGQLDISGNRHFKTALLKKKIGIKPAGYFDYSALQRSLVYINESPDRQARAILVPGKAPGTTDVVIEVEDQLPIHIGFNYDNWGSRYIDRNRYSVIFEHNNLLGQDDKLDAKFQWAEAERLVLQQARYVFPLTSNWELGAYMLFSRLKLGEEFQDLESKGRADIFGAFTNYAIIEGDDLEVRLNLGFDSKNISNELSGTQISRDELRIVKSGFDMDLEDSWGRTILTAEWDVGLANFMGSLDDKDPDCSRTGAGGKFHKKVFNLFRLQPMPFTSSLLLKNSFQYSNYNLPASEQFQIGGATSVRGYPPAEFAGDKGFYSAIEWSFPMYGLSKKVKVPFRPEERLYDALRLVMFWDIGMVDHNNPQAGEKDTQTLRAAGVGCRLNLKKNLDFRIEIAWPLDDPTPSDGDHAHTWVEFNWKF